MERELISITIDGATARLSWDDALARHRKLEGEALALERDTAAAFVRWGSMLLQVKESLEHGRWLKFLDTAANIKTAQKAMRLAQLAAGEDGELDRTLAAERIRQHNATAQDRGVRPISGRAMTRRGVEIAFGARPGDRAGGGAGDPAKGPARDHLADDAYFAMYQGAGVDGGGDGGGGGEQAARPGAGGAMAAPASGRRAGLPSGNLERGSAPSGPAHHGVGGPGRVEPASPRAMAPTGGGAETRRGGGGRQEPVGQMTLEEEYAAAAVLARDLARMFDLHAVAPEIMARFRELVDDAKLASAGKWGG